MLEIHDAVGQRYTCIGISIAKICIEKVNATSINDNNVRRLGMMVMFGVVLGAWQRITSRLLNQRYTCHQENSRLKALATSLKR